MTEIKIYLDRNPELSYIKKFQTNSLLYTRGQRTRDVYELIKNRRLIDGIVSNKEYVIAI